jgi:cytoskeleton protein RodZ
MISFGEQLKRARETAGLSLDELSARTKIRVSLLDAIERADLARLPGAFYTKGFLRAYAAEVGIAAPPIIEGYEALFEAQLPAPPPQQDELLSEWNTPPNMVELVARARSGLAPIGTFALAAALLAFAVNLRPDRPGRSVDEPGAAGTSGSGPALPAASGAPTPSGDSIAGDSHQPDLLTLDVRPTGPLWLEGTADGRRVVRKLLQPPEQLVVEARDEIKLLVGDAGTFAFSINGRPGRPLGKQGEVRTIDVKPGNYQEFLSPASN